MNDVSFNTTGGGIGFVGLLTIVFITLKLLGVTTWSWVWVLAPLWISLAIGVIAILVILVIAVIMALIDKER